MGDCKEIGLATSPEELELVRRCRAGDEHAFAEIVERHQSAIFGTALRLLGNRELAGEVANRAFFKAYQALGRFDETRPLRPWLLRIVANEALNERRGRARESTHTIAGEEAEETLERLPGGEDPAVGLVEREPREAVRAAVERLPGRMRVMMVLRYFDDLSHAEIAEQMGMSANAVGVGLLRARERVRQELERVGVTSHAMS